MKTRLPQGRFCKPDRGTHGNLRGEVPFPPVKKPRLIHCLISTEATWCLIRTSPLEQRPPFRWFITCFLQLSLTSVALYHACQQAPLSPVGLPCGKETWLHPSPYLVDFFMHMDGVIPDPGLRVALVVIVGR